MNMMKNLVILELIAEEFVGIKFKEKTALELLDYVYQYNRRDRIEKKSYYVINASLPKLIEEISKHLENRLKEKLIELDCLILQLEGEKKNRKEQFELIKQTIVECDYDWNFVNKDFKTFISEHIGLYLEQTISNNAAIERLTKELKKTPKKFAKLNDFIIKSLKQYRSQKKRAFEEAKDRGRDKSSTIELLHICNDLSKGLFKKSPGEMKEILYFLAFAFNMTVLDDYNNLEQKDFDSNVTVKLFENFYCNNIIRYLKDYKKNGIYEEPAGVPIRYNNFVELVYLYWLNKNDEEYTQYQKLTNAINMINDIRKKKNNAWKKTLSLKMTGKKYKDAVAIAYNKEHPSIELKKRFWGKENEEQISEEKEKNIATIDFKMLSLSVEEFENVLLKDYDIDEQYHYRGKKSYEGFYNQMTLRTAKAEYEKYFENVIDYFDSISLAKIWFLEPKYVSKYINIGAEDITAQELKKLLNKINEQFVDFCNTDIEDKEITRNDFLMAYWLKFVIENSENYDESFSIFYEKNVDELNSLLSKSSFQIVSKKNLFDMLLLYSAFMAVKISVEI